MTALNSYLLGYACREPWNMHAVRRWDSVPSDRATPWVTWRLFNGSRKAPKRRPP